ncbi:DUF4198 domain-containing protein [Diaphorobacter aerolatus]|uniref:DUF4198 domain-containing protein n=1 Tax=Diaphorobacter aerolatus TaxID=1288495 RepID=A0A7H0GKK7_9BURK|nr:DUF4198 domain-containing protein [Diaphorobacter aerolatus]QNP48823.1 DUF4198 domain-containing protein [Diaphorobacter aerolatus]
MTLKTRAILAATLALAAVSAQAHDMWFKPSSTVLSKSDWVTVDAAVSNDVFFFNHRPLGLENVKVTAPDGMDVELKNAHKGELRSVFDFKPEKPGTYRVSMLTNGVLGSYKDASGQPRRVRGPVDEVLRKIPADATNVNIIENVRRMETFVSVGKPSALGVTGKGLELKAVTHPNDLVSSEEARFEFFLDGKPAGNLEVELVADGIRYRDGVEPLKLRTDANGLLKVKFPRPGLFWLSTDAKDHQTSVANATERRLGYVATLEVLP